MQTLVVRRHRPLPCLIVMRDSRSGNTVGQNQRNTGAVKRSIVAVTPLTAKKASMLGKASGPSPSKHGAASIQGMVVHPGLHLHRTIAQMASTTGRPAGQTPRRVGAANMLTALAIAMTVMRASVTGRKPGPSQSESGVAKILAVAAHPQVPQSPMTVMLATTSGNQPGRKAKDIGAVPM